MDRVIVDTEVLRSVGYNARKQDLEVELKNGDLLLYLGVPAPAYLALMNSEAKDDYYARQIKEVYIYKLVR